MSLQAWVPENSKCALRTERRSPKGKHINNDRPPFSIGQTASQRSASPHPDRLRNRLGTPAMRFKHLPGAKCHEPIPVPPSCKSPTAKHSPLEGNNGPAVSEKRTGIGHSSQNNQTRSTAPGHQQRNVNYDHAKPLRTNNNTFRDINHRTPQRKPSQDPQHEQVLSF